VGAVPVAVEAAALAIPLVIAGAPAASVTAEPKIEVSGQLTQPVFSYENAIREHVRVQSTVDSDGDGKKDLVRVDIIRPKESGPGLKVPVIMQESPYFGEPGVGFEVEKKKYGADGNLTKFPMFYDNCFVPRGYAFVSVDMIGILWSDGCPTRGGPSDVLGRQGGRRLAQRPGDRLRCQGRPGQGLLDHRAYRDDRPLL
jgi:X-Pro dipeptidyl-peptidase